MITLLRLFGTLLLSAMAAASHADVAVIIHPDAPSRPARTDVINIYLGLDRSLAPVDLGNWNEVRQQFYRELIRKNEDQLKSYWATRIFTGKGRPPRPVADQAAMLDLVASDPRAIGYVDSDELDDRVQVLFILR
ncbi:phosphate ABC transporter periplasmic protein [Pseudomonas saudimassiliensis]|uniref:Phosphate ABC transporter periplasmic protein n=1 Tax=Pseudomonas saudimassiliensis TaxID=1461581 RepID=A0A078MAY0_9PSED|nr:hypothetical protein [Pseudomonas saudimassiliensis]CEA03445.1 phosphate ABC transporter periplasmic protein [Pseudomonas saudimassiliensis]CEF26194.1 phosphate ABC transporter periplasmic protein [Pseudomonas saudimassiliensis]